jgi:hypothetical protein
VGLYIHSPIRLHDSGQLVQRKDNFTSPFSKLADSVLRMCVLKNLGIAKVKLYFCLTVLFVTSGLDKCKAVYFSSAKFVSWANRLLVALHNDAFSTAGTSGRQLEKGLLKR